MYTSIYSSMCGDGKLIYKNVVVNMIYNAGVPSAPVYISVPFTADTLVVTSLTFIHDDQSGANDIYNVMCDSLTPEPLAQLPVLQSNQSRLTMLDNMYVLANYNSGQYKFRLSSVINGSPPIAGIIYFTLNLRFSMKIM